jgi:hypothetical protein
MTMAEGVEVPEESVLTQMGNVDHKVASKGRANFYFQTLLRDQDLDDGVSCYEGKLSIDEAKYLITLGEAAAGQPNDAVRHTTAGRLVKAVSR